MKIFVLGYKGMLGRYVYSYLKHKQFDVVGLGRDELDATIIDEETLKSKLTNDSIGVKHNDIIINCIGVIKSVVGKYDNTSIIKINSLFPLALSNVCSTLGVKLVCVTTDCVYSGSKGFYDENDLHDCTDVYGKTKSLGEPSNCTVIRTSIIGEEVGQTRSFIEWVKSNKDKTVNGYLNHKWNGVTCLQFSKVIEGMINTNYFWVGTKHLFSPNFVTKCELVEMVSNIYNLNVTINKVNDKHSIDRTLSSIHNNMFNVPSLEEQVQEQKDFYENIKF